MRFKRFLRSVVLTTALCPAAAFSESPQIDVEVLNLEPATGTVEVSLFDSADSFLVKPLRQQSGKAGENGTFSTSFDDVPKGDYAVVVVHDANDNNTLDLGFLGFGGECHSYSNDARPLLGRPAFEDAKFTVGNTPLSITIDCD